jgi:hypothetical protein
MFINLLLFDILHDTVYKKRYSIQMAYNVRSLARYNISFCVCSARYATNASPADEQSGVCQNRKMLHAEHNSKLQRAPHSIPDPASYDQLFLLMATISLHRTAFSEEPPKHTAARRQENTKPPPLIRPHRARAPLEKDLMHRRHLPPLTILRSSGLRHERVERGGRKHFGRRHG